MGLMFARPASEVGPKAVRQISLQEQRIAAMRLVLRRMVIDGQARRSIIPVSQFDPFSRRPRSGPVD